MCYITVFCIAVSHAQADYIIDQLKEAGFSHRDISLLLADKDFSRGKHPPVVPGHDGGWVWFAGGSVLPVPEVNLFMASGPILAALCGSRGTVAMHVSGGLFGLGLPTNQTQHFENRIRDGNILISAHTGNSEQIALAKGIFAQAGAHDICCADATEAPHARRAPTRDSRRARCSVGYLT